ncbi:MAG: hypothetical protein FH761_08280 [Firmicutes bacterium]|nr:hypothetical protein [Bacillota bacterium]
MHSYSIDTSERIKIIAYLAIISVSLSMLISKIEFPFASKIQAPSTMVLFSGLYFLFNSYAWKWKLFSFIVKTPDLSGTWEGEYQSSYICEDTKKPYKGKVNFIIEQTWTKIRIISENGKSVSCSEVAGVAINDNMGVVLRYQYKNEPKFNNVKSMNCHIGFNKLRYIEEKQRLEGDYFNDKHRGTYGVLWYEKVS